MDKMKGEMQKRVRRLQQRASQNVGLAEKKDELSNVSHVDQRIQRMITAIKNSRHNLSNCLRTGSKDEHIEKRKRKLEQYNLATGLLQDSKELETVNESGLLYDILRLYGEALMVMVDERVQTDMEVEKKVVESLTKYQEEDKSISKIKEKLSKAVLDMESNRRRLQAAPNDKQSEIQEDFDSAQYKVDSYKDNTIADMLSLASKEAEIASVFAVLVEIQADYHRTAIRTLENIMPEITRKIATYEHRPIFGCHLEDHLRYSNRKIALVLEVCCSALCELGLKEEGLFRISGNATKIRRLKAAFDAHEIDLSDYVNDPHSMAGTLKSYLRELPEPLMAQSTQSDWGMAARLDGEKRIAMITEILSQIPNANRDNLAYLIVFLHRLMANKEQTRMSASNLAIVIGPNLVGSAFEGDNMLGTRLVETLLFNVDLFFPENIQFTSPYTKSFASRIWDETGGFESSDRAVPRSMQTNIYQTESGSGFDNHAKMNYTCPKRGLATSSHKRPKQPAPPPPPPSNHLFPEYHHSDMSSSLVDFGAGDVSKSSSNDSMGDYASIDASLDDSLSKSTARCRRISPSSDSAGSLPEDPAQELKVCGPVPIRPPPPSQTTIERNAVGRGSARTTRPVSYLNAVSNVDTESKPPIAPRRTHMKTGSADENRTVVAIGDDGNMTSKPPIPSKPMRSNAMEEAAITKL